jgi:hypothetical protein
LNQLNGDSPARQASHAISDIHREKIGVKLSDSSDLRQLMIGQEAACVDGWFPMETAPRDGLEILCFTVTGDYEIAHWLPVTHCWVSKRGILVEPSRWMRLPNSPASPTPEVTEHAHPNR